ncbi:MAG: MOSC domain-containing protein [Acidobacteria bacterium]|nr:MAG: MOSC domain-containing protein [Acidobacteriota bacterium]
MSGKGELVSINISPARGTEKRPVSEAVVDLRGIRGDAHAGEWHRQVSLLAYESIEAFGSEAGRSFAEGDFAENLTVRGLDLSGVRPGDRIAAGTALLEVTQIGKRCHGHGCAVFRRVGRCVMPREGIFCRVLRPGTIRVGDPVAIERREGAAAGAC